MRKFEKDGKINFVDDNNVFVGFDYESCCCENFGWSLTCQIPTSLNRGDSSFDPEGFQFDTKFVQHGIEAIDVEEGGIVVFRLTKDKAELFLTLWNSHNGYYGHGFEMSINAEIIHKGYL